MSKLTRKSLTVVAGILDEYVRITDAIHRADKGTGVYDFSVTVVNSKDEHDFIDVKIPGSMAKTALAQYQQRLATRLHEYGIEAE